MEELKLRKIFILVLLTIFLLPTVTTALARGYEPSVMDFVIENDNNVKDFKEYTFEDILSIEPYVHVEDGLLVLNETAAIEAGIDNEQITNPFKEDLKAYFVKESRWLTAEAIVNLGRNFSQNERKELFEKVKRYI